jgi:xanthine dehydrogenase YagS FAD-binding subunit
MTGPHSVRETVRVAHRLEDVHSDVEALAGGTDLSERLRSRVSTGPVMDITRLPGLTGVETRPDGGLSIGALTRLVEVAEHPDIRQRYPALAESTAALATPQIRSAATLGGALCQRTRCWYYRHPDLSCFKSGGSACLARNGNAFYGVAFDLGPCVHPHPSSVALGLMAYDATIDTSRRGSVTLAELFGDGSDPTRDHQLGGGEVLTHVTLPQVGAGERCGHYRLMARRWAEWPLVECVVRLGLRESTVELARVCLGAVANVPLRAPAAEATLVGRAPTAELIEEAAQGAVGDASPLEQTRYKLPLIVATVREALERALG